ncbi:MAG: PaaI family thioesterase [Burkholderiaceae bacterium]
MSPTTDSTASADLANVFHRVPFTKLLGVTRELSENGLARLRMPMRPEFTNLFDSAHGGVLMTLLDTAMASAAVSSTGFRSSAVTLSMSVNFLQAGKGTLTIEGRRTGGGRSVCYCEGVVFDEQGKALARAIGTFKFKALELIPEPVIPAAD